MKNSYITVTDQFCGAGGSSQGVHNYADKIGGGLEVKMALNHWKLAIETHSTNFQNTMHDCTDISACDPRRYPSTDILITSPECTNHSLAKGQKQVKAQIDLFDSGKLDAAAERSRATMWDVCRFAEYHNYNAIIVENVVDARKWVMFEAWLNAMHILGYKHKCVYLNSQHCHPTPQSRDRMYIVFWKKGNKTPNLDFTPLAFSPRLGKDVNSVQTWKSVDKKFGKYRQQYVYCCPVTGDVVEPYFYASMNIIDWSDLGTRIGDRKKELSPNTEKRIKAGLKKYGGENPLMVHNYTPGYCTPVTRSSGTFKTVDSQAILCPPFIFKGEHTLQSGYTRSVNETLQTQTVRQSMGLVVPHIVELNRTGESKPSTAPFSTFTAGVPNHGIMTTEAMQSFLTYYYRTIQNSHVTEVMRTATTNDRMSLVTNVKTNIEDCYYRMVKPREIKLGMAFNRDYIVLGSGKDQVKQLGNAVTPPAMEMLVERIVQSLN
jgi:DNA (cytosine-5)-methyltransferase 1